jgi:hypothetical protein
MFIGSLAIVVFCHKQIGAVAKILEKGVNNGNRSKLLIISSSDIANLVIDNI